MPNVAWCTLAAAMLLSPCVSHATLNQAWASFSNISIQLIDLDPLDGIAPAMSTYDVCSAIGLGSRGSCDGPDWISRTTATSPLVTAKGYLSVDDPFAIPDYQYSNPIEQIETSATQIKVYAARRFDSSSYVSAFDIEVFSTYQEDFDNGEGDYYSYVETYPGFSITPNTRLEISGDVDLGIVDACSPPRRRTCHSRASVSISANDPATSQSLVIDSGLGDPNALHQHMVFAVESGTGGLGLKLGISVTASGAVPVSAAIPEANVGAMMLWGLGVLAFVPRLRRAIRNSLQRNGGMATLAAD